jgi:hypothetical protein
MVGHGLTVRTAVGDNLVVHQSLEVCGPRPVLVFDAAGSVDRAIVGRSCVAMRAAGIVVDSAVRDVAAMAGLRFCVFVQAYLPWTSTKRPWARSMCGQLPARLARQEGAADLDGVRDRPYLIASAGSPQSALSRGQQGQRTHWRASGEKHEQRVQDHRELGCSQLRQLVHPLGLDDVHARVD